MWTYMYGEIIQSFTQEMRIVISIVSCQDKVHESNLTDLISCFTKLLSTQVQINNNKKNKKTKQKNKTKKNRN